MRLGVEARPTTRAIGQCRKQVKIKSYLVIKFWFVGQDAAGRT
jgi:hypothetical protein